MEIGNTRLPCPVCQNGAYRAQMLEIVHGQLKDCGRLLQTPLCFLVDGAVALPVPGGVMSVKAISKALAVELDGWIAGPRQHGLTLIGDIGRGKSTVAVAASIEFCVAHEFGSVMYVPLSKWSRRLRAAFDEHSSVAESEYDQVQALERVGLLILDDLGKEKASPYGSEAVYEIIEERWRMLRPTVVTMNMELDALRDRLGAYGGAVVSRLIQMNGRPLELTGRDFRKVE